MKREVILLGLFCTLLYVGSCSFNDDFSNKYFKDCAQKNPNMCVGLGQGDEIPSCDNCNTCTCLPGVEGVLEPSCTSENCSFLSANKKNPNERTYAICKQISWNGISRVKVFGTNTYLEPEKMRKDDLRLNPECKKENVDGPCEICWYYTSEIEPMFEIQLLKGAAEKNVCRTVVRRYYVDGVNKGCKDGKWEYIDHNAYFPYNGKRYKFLKQIEESME